MKKIVLFSLIACLGFVGNSFGSCDLTVAKTDVNGQDFIRLGGGDNGFACNRIGARSCNDGEIVWLDGKHTIDGTEYNGRKFYKCVKGNRDKWTAINFAELPDCAADRQDGTSYFAGIHDGFEVYVRYPKWGMKNGVRYGLGNLCVSARVAIVYDDSSNTTNGNDEVVKEGTSNKKNSTSSTKKTSSNKVRGDEKSPCEGGACAVFPDGGDVEQNRCLKNASATRFEDKWMEAGSNCNAKNAKIGRCFKQKNRAGSDVMSCAAKICDEDSALWLYRISENNYQSYGLCYRKDFLQKKYCDKGNDECKKCNGRCELNVIKWKNGSFGETNAFYDDKLCLCVADDNGGGGEQKEQKPNVCPEKDCKDTCNVTINESIKCNNGKKFESKKTVKVCKECVEQQNMTCDQYQETINKCDDLKCIENRLKQLTEIDKLLKEWCGAGYSTTTPDNSAQINAAKSTISSFFSSAESSASVWKDKDGNFNTARLASDLTAGVVLGTVGGVVSGVVIKKKQVEKGFDALHCTVNGQTIADWGDIFNVGLRR